MASRVTEKSDVLLLQAVDMDDSGPYAIAEPRAITALETYTPSCKLMHYNGMGIAANIDPRATNAEAEAVSGDSICPSHCSARKARGPGVRWRGRAR